MKLTTKLTAVLMALALVSVSTVSCGDQQQQQKKQTTKSAASPALPQQQEEKLVIRYIDADTLVAKYNLAKDFNEAAITMQNNYDAAQKNQQNAIAKLQSEFQAKDKKNVYASDPQQAQADQNRYEHAVNAAQKKLGQMQQNMVKQSQANQQQLMDSINNYLKIYAKDKGYDMILNKSTAAFYMDPKYDVTNEVVKGLNTRYTKVTKKK